MATKKPAFEFVVAQLKKNPKVAYSEVHAAAEKKGHTIYPIMYGRAKRLLGLVAAKSGKKVAKKKVGRPLGSKNRKPSVKKTDASKPAATSSVATSTVAGLEGVFEVMRSNEADRERYHAALVRIREILNEIL